MQLIGGFIVSLVLRGSFVGGGGVGLSLVDLSVDVIVELDVALGELSLPVADGVVLLAGLVLVVLESLSLVVTVAVALSGHIPVELVVRDVLQMRIKNSIKISV